MIAMTPATADNAMRVARLRDAFADVYTLAHLLGEYHARLNVRREILLADEGLPLSRGLRWAVRWLGNRLGLLKDEFEALTDRAKAQAFTVARLMDRFLVERVRQSLQSALLRGETMHAWRDGQLSQILGDEGLADAHAETVFRTTFQSTHQAAIKRAYDSPALGDFIQAYEYVTLDDDRVRPAHAAMHGVVAPKNDPVWSSWWPPNGFNCRCQVVPVTIDDVEEGAAVTTGTPSDVAPDDGFSSTPEGV